MTTNPDDIANDKAVNERVRLLVAALVAGDILPNTFTSQIFDLSRAEQARGVMVPDMPELLFDAWLAAEAYHDDIDEAARKLRESVTPSPEDHGRQS